MDCVASDTARRDWFNLDLAVLHARASSTLGWLIRCTGLNGQRVNTLAHQLGQGIINEAVPRYPRDAAETTAHDLNAEVPSLFGTRMACVQVAVVLHLQFSRLQSLL